MTSQCCIGRIGRVTTSTQTGRRIVESIRSMTASDRHHERGRHVVGVRFDECDSSDLARRFRIQSVNGLTVDPTDGRFKR